MTDPRVSVIIVSRGRPDGLKRCLVGLAQLFFHPFEVVVVADPAGIAAISDWKSRVKWAEFDRANISAARNIGARMSAGEILAFIDDDAVAEPTWLGHLVAPFRDPTVSIAGGYVVGNDGIRFQYKAGSVDQAGKYTKFEIEGDEPVVFDAPTDQAIKTEGTNFAIRRDVLSDIGGFDEAFHYYMDETELNWRLARAGHKTALVPLAQVHPWVRASAQRKSSLMPITLFDIGASQVVYLRKHLPDMDPEPVLDGSRAHFRRIVDFHLGRRNCTESEAKQVLMSLEEGFAAGRERDFGVAVDLGPPPQPFKPFAHAPGNSASIWLAARFWNRRRLEDRAMSLVATGARVSLFLFGPTARSHRAYFDPHGFWVQHGGLFGRSARPAPRFQFFTFRGRVQHEVARVRDLRGFSE